MTQSIEIMTLLMEYDGNLAGEPEAIHKVASLILAKIAETEREAIPMNAMLVGSGVMGRSLAEAASLLSVSSGHVFECAWCEPSSDGNSYTWGDNLPFAKRVKGKIVYIIDDVPAADTLDQVIKLVNESGGKVGGIVRGINHSPNVTAGTLGAPWLISLFEVKMRPRKSGSRCSVGRASAMAMSG